jgi:hypothetical protein
MESRLSLCIPISGTESKTLFLKNVEVIVAWKGVSALFRARAQRTREFDSRRSNSSPTLSTLKRRTIDQTQSGERFFLRGEVSKKNSPAISECSPSVNIGFDRERRTGCGGGQGEWGGSRSLNVIQIVPGQPLCGLDYALLVNIPKVVGNSLE